MSSRAKMPDQLGEIYGDMQMLVAIAELVEEEVPISRETMRLQCAMAGVLKLGREVLRAAKRGSGGEGARL